MKERTKSFLVELIKKYPQLGCCKDNIESVFLTLKNCFEKSFFYRVVEIFGITYNSVGQALLAEHICLYLKEKFPCLKEKTK